MFEVLAAPLSAPALGSRWACSSLGGCLRPRADTLKLAGSPGDIGPCRRHLRSLLPQGSLSARMSVLNHCIPRSWGAGLGVTFVPSETMLSLWGPLAPCVPLLLSRLCACAPDWSSLAPVSQSEPVCWRGMERWTPGPGRGARSVTALGHSTACLPRVLGASRSWAAPLRDLHTSPVLCQVTFWPSPVYLAGKGWS